MLELIPSFILYLFILVLIAIVAGRRSRTFDEYTIGNRTLGSSVTALSAGASDMSGWLLLGLPGAIYATGLVEGWILIGLVLCAWLNWTFVAKRLRIGSTLYDDAYTIPQFLALRTGAGRGSIFVTFAFIVLIVFYTIYVSAGFIASTKLFEATLGIEYSYALLIGVSIVMIYTAVGGFFAVCWTDAFQAILMLLALILIPLLALTMFGDLSPATSSKSIWNLGAYSAMGVLGLLSWGLGYFGQPHILTRFLAIRDPNLISNARTIGMSWMVLTAIGAVAVGYAGIHVLPGIEDPETILIRLSALVLNPWIAGIIIAAILAAVMSTVDSQLMVVSTTLINDTIKPKRHALLYSRLCVIIVAVVAALFALDENSEIFGTVALAWAGIGASFGPCVLFSLFYRRTTSNSLIACIVTGTVVTIVWRLLEGGIFDIYELLPAFCMSSIVLYIVARVWPDEEAEDRFDQLQEKLVSGTAS